MKALQQSFDATQELTTRVKRAGQELMASAEISDAVEHMVGRAMGLCKNMQESMEKVEALLFTQKTAIPWDQGLSVLLVACRNAETICRGDSCFLYFHVANNFIHLFKSILCLIVFPSCYAFSLFVSVTSPKAGFQFLWFFGFSTQGVICTQPLENFAMKLQGFPLNCNVFQRLHADQFVGAILVFSIFHVANNFIHLFKSILCLVVFPSCYAFPSFVSVTSLKAVFNFYGFSVFPSYSFNAVFDLVWKSIRPGKRQQSPSKNWRCSMQNSCRCTSSTCLVKARRSRKRGANLKRKRSGRRRPRV